MVVDMSIDTEEDTVTYFSFSEVMEEIEKKAEKVRTMSMLEVLGRCEEDAEISAIKKKLLSNRLLKLLRNGTIEEKKESLKTVCKDCVFIWEARNIGIELGLKLHAENKVYVDFLGRFRDSKKLEWEELANTLGALGGGTPEEVLKDHIPSPRSQTFAATYSWVLATQNPAYTVVGLHIGCRILVEVCTMLMAFLKPDLEALDLTEEDLGFFGMYALVDSIDMHFDYAGFCRGAQRIFEESCRKDGFNYEGFSTTLQLLLHSKLDFYEGHVPPELMLKYLECFERAF